ncbi:hypothetical protein N665_0403s0006 [Sinapis alba]|nr:hypothetical protein N665_0403s0006 [Sinapis alba]
MVVYCFNPQFPSDLLALPLKAQTNLVGNQKAEFVKPLHEQVRRNIEERTKMYANTANKGRRELILEPGELVWIHLRKERFLAERNSKLMPRKDGPFQVLKRINNNANQIDLQGKYTVSSTFNVSDLSHFVSDDANLSSNPFEGGENDADKDKKDQQEKPNNQTTKIDAGRFTDNMVEPLSCGRYVEVLGELGEEDEELSDGPDTEDEPSKEKPSDAELAKERLSSKEDDLEEIRINGSTFTVQISLRKDVSLWKPAWAETKEGVCPTLVKPVDPESDPLVFSLGPTTRSKSKAQLKALKSMIQLVQAQGRSMLIWSKKQRCGSLSYPHKTIASKTTDLSRVLVASDQPSSVPPQVIQEHTPSKALNRKVFASKQLALRSSSIMWRRCKISRI